MQGIHLIDGLIVVVYLARVVGGQLQAMDEPLEVQPFALTEVPWDELAFATMRRALHLFFADRRQGCFNTHVEDFVRPPASPRKTGHTPPSHREKSGIG